MADDAPRFGRLIPAMVTPFDEDRELDLVRAQAWADRLVEGGSDALIINGTTGESPTVFYPQKMDLFRAVVAAVDGRVPVIANVGDNCTADTVEFANNVAPLGVDPITTSRRRRACTSISAPSPMRWSCRSSSTTSPAAAW